MQTEFVRYGGLSVLVKFIMWEMAVETPFGANIDHIELKVDIDCPPTTTRETMQFIRLQMKKWFTSQGGESAVMSCMFLSNNYRGFYSGDIIDAWLPFDKYSPLPIIS
jgi:hypothetical protein